MLLTNAEEKWSNAILSKLNIIDVSIRKRKTKGTKLKFNIEIIFASNHANIYIFIPVYVFVSICIILVRGALM